MNGTEYPAQDRTATMSWNRILTAHTLNEFRVGVNKQDIPRADQAFIPQQIGNLTGYIADSEPGTAARQWRQLDADSTILGSTWAAFAESRIRVAHASITAGPTIEKPPIHRDAGRPSGEPVHRCLRYDRQRSSPPEREQSGDFTSRMTSG